MRWLLPALLLIATPAWASPADKFDRWLQAGRALDVVEPARRWLDRNADDADAERVHAQLAEATYQVLLSKPDPRAVEAWLREFAGHPREADARNLLANLALYAASAEGTEAAYRAVYEGHFGRPAAEEALLRADELGFAAAKDADSIDGWRRYLSEYPDAEHGQPAWARLRELTWAQAEAQDTVGAWFALRVDDPEHPRLQEAYAREQARALEAVPADADAGKWLSVARRYGGTPGGWTALLRAVELSNVRLQPGDAAPLGDLPRPADGARLAAFDAPGRLPDGAAVAVSVEVERGGAWLPWESAARASGGDWLPDLPPPAEGFDSLLPLCRLPGQTGARLVLRASAGERQRRWEQPLSVQRPCGGHTPWAVLRDAEGRVSGQRLGGVEGGAPDVLGVPWRCDGPLHADAQGAWLTCNGWQLSPAGEGWFVRLPPREVGPAPEEPGFPEGVTEPPAEGRWLLAQVPLAWHFGGRPPCPLDRGADGEPGPLPAWVPPSAPVQAQRDADLDGDEQPDRAYLLGKSSQWLLVVTAGAPPNSAWVGPASPLEGVARVGCGFGSPEGP